MVELQETEDLEEKKVVMVQTLVEMEVLEEAVAVTQITQVPVEVAAILVAQAVIVLQRMRPAAAEVCM